MSDFFGAMGTALYAKLAGGTALVAALGGSAIYADQAPQGATPPYVIFSHQGGGVESTYAVEMRSNLWFVRAWADSRSEAAYIDGLCLDLLHRGSLTVSGWSTIWLWRESDMELTDNLPNGVQRYMAGGMYRVRLSK